MQRLLVLFLGLVLIAAGTLPRAYAQSSGPEGDALAGAPSSSAVQPDDRVPQLEA